LVFIDETWASTKMARTHGRCRRGQRLRIGVPHGHWKTTTFVAGLTTRGMVAPFVLDGPINRNAFETYVERVLVPELRKGDIVVMDNLSSHKGTMTRQRIEAAARASSTCRPTRLTSTNRKRLRQTQGALAQGRLANRRRPLGGNRPHGRPPHACRMPKLLRRRRI
jgi:hypothetical protein